MVLIAATCELYPARRWEFLRVTAYVVAAFICLRNPTRWLKCSLRSSGETGQLGGIRTSESFKPGALN